MTGNYPADADSGGRRVLSAVLASHWALLLCSLVCVGGALRFYGLANYEGTDEYNEVFEALRVASGHFNYERWWKKGYQNILAVEYGMYFVQGYLRGVFASPMDFAAQIIRDMDPLFLIGRYTTAFLGTASIALTYLIGRHMYNERVGLLAAGFLMVSPLHVWISHLVNTDVPLTFFFLCSLYFVCRFSSTGHLPYYAWAAALGAVTVNMKLTGFGIGVLFIGAHVYRALREGRSYAKIVWCKEIGVAAASFIAGFVASNPPVVLGFTKWIQSFIWQYGIHQNVYDQVPYAVGDSGYYTYLLLLYGELGAPLFVCTAVAIVYGFLRRDQWSLLMVACLIIVFAVLGSTTYLIQNRYFMSLMPLLFILNGRLLDDVVMRFRWPMWRKALSLLAVFGVLTFVPSQGSLAFTRTLTDRNTSSIAKEWIEKNIPPGSKILIDAGHTLITSGPRISQSRENLELQLNQIRNLKEGETFDSPQVKIVDSYSAIYFELLLRNMPQVTYDLTTTELGRQIQPLQYYLENGFEYFVHNGDVRDNFNSDAWKTKYPQSAAFYESLDSSLELIKSFEPSETRPGQPVRIYRFKRRYPPPIVFRPHPHVCP
ncbi:MAG TPA: glycosyltransferase family 39 protein [Nitrospira sp.]|nr:glycosyltransferase family 39 protein [Nitrospira sp.]